VAKLEVGFATGRKAGARSGREALDEPAPFLVPAIAEAIVETTATALPELDGLRRHAIAFIASSRVARPGMTELCCATQAPSWLARGLE